MHDVYARTGVHLKAIRPLRVGMKSFGFKERKRRGNFDRLISRDYKFPFRCHREGEIIIIIIFKVIGMQHLCCFFFIFDYITQNFLMMCVCVFVLSEPPFHLTRRGWGEFPVRIQIHFKDTRNKRIDIIHQLKVRTLHRQLASFPPQTWTRVLSKASIDLLNVILRVLQPHNGYIAVCTSFITKSPFLNMLHCYWCPLWHHKELSYTFWKLKQAWEVKNWLFSFLRRSFHWIIIVIVIMVNTHWKSEFYVILIIFKNLLIVWHTFLFYIELHKGHFLESLNLT